MSQTSPEQDIHEDDSKNQASKGSLHTPVFGADNGMTENGAYDLDTSELRAGRDPVDQARATFDDNGENILTGDDGLYDISILEAFPNFQKMSNTVKLFATMAYHANQAYDDGKYQRSWDLVHWLYLKPDLPRYHRVEVLHLMAHLMPSNMPAFMHEAELVCTEAERIDSSPEATRIIGKLRDMTQKIQHSFAAYSDGSRDVVPSLLKSTTNAKFTSQRSQEDEDQKSGRPQELPFIGSKSRRGDRNGPRNAASNEPSVDEVEDEQASGKRRRIQDSADGAQAEDDHPDQLSHTFPALKEVPSRKEEVDSGRIPATLQTLIQTEVSRAVASGSMTSAPAKRREQLRAEQLQREEHIRCQMFTDREDDVAEMRTRQTSMGELLRGERARLASMEELLRRDRARLDVIEARLHRDRATWDLRMAELMDKDQE